MADVAKLLPIIVEWESDKFVNNLLDHGGPTKEGITLATWKSVGYDKDGDHDIDVDDIRLLDRNDLLFILDKYYWDRWKADQIQNQSIANILVDWVWGSGKWCIILPQRILKVMDDGKVGQMTLDAINTADQSGLFNALWQAREVFIESIVSRDPSQETFLLGWLNRLKDFKFTP